MAARTFETTLHQRQQLQTDGYVLLPGALPSHLLTRWRDLAERLEVKALDAHAMDAFRGQNIEGGMEPVILGESRARLLHTLPS